MLDRPKQFHLQQEFFTGAISIRMAIRREDGGRDVATSITFEKQSANQVVPSLLELQPEEAQNLADQLYAAGIRPSAAAGSAGQLDAVKYHLEDLRTLVFKGTKP